MRAMPSGRGNPSPDPTPGVRIPVLPYIEDAICGAILLRISGEWLGGRDSRIASDPRCELCLRGGETPPRTPPQGFESPFSLPSKMQSAGLSCFGSQVSGWEAGIRGSQATLDASYAFGEGKPLPGPHPRGSNPRSPFHRRCNLRGYL